MSPLKLLKTLSLIISLIMSSFLAKAQLMADFTASVTAGCAPLAVSFTNTSTGGAVSYNWNDGNGNTFTLPNPGTTYLIAGNYTVTLTVTNASGATSVKTKLITVSAKPTVAFSATPTTGCSPLSVTFTNTSNPNSTGITNYLWDFGNGTSSTLQNPSNIYTEAGVNNVTLQVTNASGCISTLPKLNYINVSAAVNALFTYTPPTGCGFPQTINFTNTSTGGSGALTYLWDFGDGTNSTTLSPAHTYTAIGTYTVKLITTSASGCTNTYIHPTPIVIGAVSANFTTPLISCVNTGIVFTNTSTPAPVSASWNFGDGTTSTAINPVKVYTAAGSYTVTLISNFGGCQATKTQTVIIEPKPLTAFTTTTLLSCKAPHTVNFTNITTGATAYLWQFGDGTTSTDLNPVHTYNALGTYGITLIATNANGCSDTLHFIDSVRLKRPLISIGNTPAKGCAPLSVTLNAIVDGLTPVTSYEWLLGDGTTSAVANPNHTYAAGVYDVTLIVNSAIGCSDTVTAIGGVKSNIKPIPNFTASPLNTCAIFPVDFQNLSTGVGAGTIYTWIFGDGNVGSGVNPSHQYEDTGFFNIVLIVENDGCIDSVRFNNFVHINAPIAAFNVVNSCNTNRFTKTFTNNSIAADSYLWEFGDGGTSTLEFPTHTYAAVGTYNVKLTVHNDSTGCDYDRTISIVISNEPANFTASLTEMCKGTSTIFTATSINATSGITSYAWDFGDGTFGTTNSITHTYANNGSYTVKLIVKDLNGCSDTLPKVAYIKVYGPTVAFGSNLPGTCINGNIIFTDQSVTDGIHPIINWTWNYGDGSTVIPNGTVPSISHAYTTAGVFDVGLVIKDSYGCEQTLVKPSFVTVSLPVSAFSTNNRFTCRNQPVVFTNNSTGPGLSFLWNFGDGNTSTLQNPTHLFATDGNFTVTLHVLDSYGCTADTTKIDYIQVITPVASFTMSDSLATCSQLNVQFVNTTNNVVSQTWDFGDMNTSSLPSPSHFYATPGNFVVKLTTTSVGGCISVKTRNILVRGPQGTFTYSPLVGCDSLRVHFVSSTVDRVSFIWDYNDGIIQATSDSMPYHTYAATGSYVPKMILVGTVAGCQLPVTGLDTIKVIGVSGTFTPSVTNLCNSSGDVTFTTNVSSNDAITGYAWNFGDASTSANQNPTHTYSSTGIYAPTLQVTTQAGCTKNIGAVVPIRVVANPQITKIGRASCRERVYCVV